MTDYQLAPGGEEKLESIRHHAEDVFLDATEGDDFLGVQVYTRMLIGPDGWAGYEEGVPVLDMGYEFYPASLGNCLRRAWDYTGGSVPLLVTENGIGTTDDEQRIDYVRQALVRCAATPLADGVDVRGYTYWSLLDNFEWAMGYRPKFGIVDVDRDDVRPDAEAECRLAGLGRSGQRTRLLRSTQTAASSVLATMASMMVSQSASGRSWPMPGMVSSLEPGTAAAVASPPLGVTSGSASPWTTRNGHVAPRAAPPYGRASRGWRRVGAPCPRGNSDGRRPRPHARGAGARRSDTPASR